MSWYKYSLSKLLFIVLLIVSFYLLNALSSFNEYKEKVQPEIELTLTRFYWFLEDELKFEQIKYSDARPIEDKTSPLKTFHFTLTKTPRDEFNNNSTAVEKEQVIKAYLFISDEPKNIRKINISVEGDIGFRSQHPQKDMRIKLSSNNTYHMDKTFDLIHLSYANTLVNSINYILSSSLGLITPDFYPVKVLINGEFNGVYMYRSQVDESLLRKKKKMPGSIYLGKNTLSSHEGGSSLWDDSKYWAKIASRNSEQNRYREDIEYFINSISKMNDLEFYRFVNDSLSKQQYYSFFALDVIFGNTYPSIGRKLLLYFDPYKGKFEPIKGDLGFWDSYDTKDISVNPLLEKISLNPILEYQRDKFSYELMQKALFKPDHISTRLTEMVKNQSLGLNAGLTKEEAGNVLKQTLQHYKARQAALVKIYQDAKVTYKMTELSSRNYLLEIRSSGNTAVEMKVRNHLKVDIYKDVNFNRLADADEAESSKVELLYPGRVKVARDVEIDNESIVRSTHLIPSGLYYSFIVKTKEPGLSLADFIFTNKITGELVSAMETKELLKDNISDSIHPWDLRKSTTKTVVIEGVVNVNKTLVFDKDTSVIIKPDTTFLMAEKCSIYFDGRVVAIGTQEEPIKFIARDITKPWGIVAVQGKATTGSLFEYVNFKNGSIDTRNLIHYTSPFNIHDTNWFEVRHCRIGRNFVGDDAMHIAYAKGVVDNNEFINATSDGLDIDIAEVKMTNNIFFKSGNDGLDIMTTTLKASNNTFIDIGDKGISIGEWSKADITDSFFLRTGTGIAIKDKSRVSANNLVIVDAKELSINLYNKNRRYDEGGFLDADTIHLLGNTNVKADHRSEQQIKARVENTLPNLKPYGWYKNLQKTPYKKLIDEVEMKYAY